MQPKKGTNFFPKINQFPFSGIYLQKYGLITILLNEYSGKMCSRVLLSFRDGMFIHLKLQLAIHPSLVICHGSVA